MASISVEMLINELENIINKLKEQQDEKHELKANQLKDKLMQPALSIALCGHFSAGKSTLINTLCGAKLLPSSPIPTSANIVTLQYGDTAEAEVEILHQGQSRKATVPIDELAHYCIDGETYASITINYPSPFLKQGIQLLDTPGIDSTDDAHRMSTESALHLADVVFYVMDYNHVQSEINFSFAKQLKEWGKPLYFIVNQIDKHRDEELSFESYKKSVWQAFQAWHLEPAGIVYLSLKKPEHKEHQWQSLLKLNEELIEMTASLKVTSVQASIKQVMNDHLDWVKHKLEPQLDDAAKLIGGREAFENIIEQIADQQALINEINEERDKLIPQFRIELESILKNANITPASMRDKMGLFLESRKPGFKQGFLFTKGKTEAEQLLRVETAYNHLLELVQSNIIWHIQQLLRDYVKPFSLSSDVVDEYVKQLNNVMPKQEWLVELISSGAVFGNEYTMTYCGNVAESLKRMFKERTIAILEQMITVELAHLFVHRIQHINEHINKLEATLQGGEQYFAINQQYSDYRKQTVQHLESFISIAHLKLPEVKKVNEHEGAIASFVEQNGVLNISQTDVEIEFESGISQVNQLRDKYNEVSRKLDASCDILSSVTQLQPLATRLVKKSNRLKQMNFTISLFGAFSAGKSSLANALIGDAVLPVSPNPTTAAINSILPPDESHPHNTATIYMKTEQMMVDDLIYSLRLLGLYTYKEQVDKKKLFDIIDKIKPEDVSNSGRAHYSFVKAARKGWISEGKHLGQSIEVNREQYVSYVAEESLSCFVQEIKFYYDCPLTSSGIVLVDTPGADSVNARHTGVAFNYIKNTDAIIFVTYYNHAFSHADRQFLDQLGRVKDQFELDKMFFVVNAADLAATEEELQGVLTHVKTNLEAHQIKQARLFPISSIMALEGKQSEDDTKLIFSGMRAFEHQFYTFIQHELGEIVVQSALNEHEAVKQEVQRLVTLAKQNIETKDTHISSLQQILSQLHRVLTERKSLPVPEALVQEIQALTFYIVQRIQLRFTDFYNYAFNPASIKEEGQSLQQVLFTAWLELERSLSLELKQELLATTLRINKFVNKIILDESQFVMRWLEANKLQPNWEFQKVELLQPKENEDWQLSTITSKWLWQYFKSAKQFFEQQGKQQLRAELEPLIFASMKDWMGEVTKQWSMFYSEQYKHAYNETLITIQEHSEAYINHAIHLLNDETYLNTLEQISSTLQQQS